MDDLEKVADSVFNWALAASVLLLIVAIFSYRLHSFATMAFALAVIVIIWLVVIAAGLFTILSILHRRNKRGADNHGQARTN